MSSYYGSETTCVGDGASIGVYSGKGVSVEFEEYFSSGLDSGKVYML